MKPISGNTEFVCRDCGSPSIKLPRELNGDSLVCCGRCQQTIGSWLDYKRSVGLSIRSDVAAAGKWLSADPAIDLAAGLR